MAEGWGYGSVLEHLLRMHRALASIASTANKQSKQNQKGTWPIVK